MTKITAIAVICAAGGGALALAACSPHTPTVPGGEPKEIVRVSTLVQRYSVPPEALNHIPDLAAYFHARCTVDLQQTVCVMIGWGSDQAVPRQMGDLTDAQLAAETVWYNLNTNTRHEEIIKYPNGAHPEAYAIADGVISKELLWRPSPMLGLYFVNRR